MKQIVTYSSPFKTMVFLLLLLFVTFFHESEKIAHFASGKKANNIDVDTTFNFTNGFYSCVFSMADSIESFKSFTGLSYYYKGEELILDKVSESPVLFKKEKIIKENSRIKPEFKEIKTPDKAIKTNSYIKKKDIKIPFGKQLTKKIVKKIAKKGFAPPYRFLFVGDSMVQSPLGIDIEKKLMGIPRSSVIKKGVVSSGLLRPDYYNWSSKLNNFISIYNPGIVVIMLGTNDISSLYHPGKKRFYSFNSKRMKKYYRSNVKNLMQIVKNYNLNAFWIGLPATEKDEINEKLEVINSIHKGVASEFDNIHYIETWNLLRNEDESVKKFIVTEGRKRKIRSSDGIHYTEFGGAFTGKYIFNSITKTIKNNQQTPPKRYAKTVKKSYKSQIFNKRIFLQAYIPQSDDDSYPAVYLFSGMKRNTISFYNKHEKYLRWLSQTFKCIVITPHISGTWAESDFNHKSNKSFKNELLPFIKAKFPVNSKISLVGINEGGAGALKLALENPGSFVSASSINGLFYKTKKKKSSFIISKDIKIPFSTRLLISSRGKARNISFFTNKVKEILKGTGVNLTNSENSNYKLYKYLIVEIKNHIRYHVAAVNHTVLDLDEVDEHGNTQLIRSIKRGYLDITKDLLMGNARVNVQNLNGTTPMMTAAHYNRLKTAAILIDNNAKIYIRDKSGKTALMYAASRGNNKIVSLLIRNGADVNARDHYGSTPILMASQRGLLKTVKILHRSGAKINIFNNDKKSPLMEAVKRDRFEISKYLLSNGSNVNDKDNLGWTSLMKSSLRGYVKITKLLLKYGAKVNTKDLQKRTPLMAAAWKGKTKIVEMLIKEGSDLKLKDKHGETPLIKAVKYNKRRTVKYLLSQKANINEVDLSLSTPLLHSAKSGLYHMVKLLLNSGADIEKVNSNGWTPLQIASMKGHKRVVDILLKRGAKVNVVSSSGKNALIYATCEAHHDTVKLLLDYGSDINLKDENDKSSLHYAIINNLYKISELLIVKGNFPSQDELPYIIELIKKSELKKLATLISTVQIIRKGDALFKKGIYKEAIAQYKTAIALEEKVNRVSVIPDILSSIGRCFFEMKKYKNALTYYKKSMKYRERKELIANNFNNIGKTYYTNKKYSSAVNYMTGSLMLSEEIKYNEKGFVSKKENDNLYIVNVKQGLSGKKPFLAKLYSKRVKLKKDKKKQLEKLISWDAIKKIRDQIKDDQIILIYTDYPKFDLQLLLTQNNTFIRNSKKIFIKTNRKRYIGYSKTFLKNYFKTLGKRNSEITAKKAEIHKRRFNKIFNINYDIQVDPKMENSSASKAIGKIFFDSHKG
ncbi:MAG: DUF459 domain-containing protein [Desulfobacterales bacterium]|nr:DUF459 domain-containing protein [Desulfobacterales bacterium]MCP4161110.1 DUF459 domain-containing protein [Deltaproteobacteria bacterium]